MRKIILSFIFLIYVLYPNDTETVKASNKNANDLMEVHFINVGQGDSILVETPNEKKVLIDGGPPSAGNMVVSYLRQQGIHTLDLLVATHPDIDHIGGLIPVMKQFKVKQVLDSGIAYYTDTYFDYINQITKNNIPVTFAKLNKIKQVDKSIQLKILNSVSLFKSNNQSSMAIALKYKDMDFLLMSDVEKEQELKMVKNYDLKAEILKVAHHGSDTSSSLEFLKEVQPETAIITYSKDNDYGHPVSSTIDHLLTVGATIYSTAKAGNIVVKTDGYNYWINISGTGYLVQKRIS